MSLAAVTDICRPCSRGSHDSCTLHDKCGCEECNPLEPPVVIWEDPPNPHGRGRRSFDLTGEQRVAMQANPGRWARLNEYKADSGASTNAKKLREANPGWEFIGRKVGKAGSVLYGRFVGEVKA